MQTEDPVSKFEQECRENIAKSSTDNSLSDLSKKWFLQSCLYKYSYNFRMLGRPIIQFPQDMVQLQELIWKVKPDLIVETGIAHGGSLILSASMLALIDYCDAVERGQVLDPAKTKRRVVGIDIDIRKHNREAIEAHPMSHMINMLQGSSIDQHIVQQVHDIASKHQTIMVILDSNHTHEHVLEELRAYAPLTSRNSYCIVFDTVVEDMPDEMFPDRPWGQGNNPKTAVWEYLRELSAEKVTGLDGSQLNFEIHKEIEQKLLVTVAPDGFLYRK